MWLHFSWKLVVASIAKRTKAKQQGWWKDSQSYEHSSRHASEILISFRLFGFCRCKFNKNLILICVQLEFLPSPSHTHLRLSVCMYVWVREWKGKIQMYENLTLNNLRFPFGCYSTDRYWMRRKTASNKKERRIMINWFV